MIKFPVTLPLLVALGFTLGAVQAQAQTKKELAAKIVQLLATRHREPGHQPAERPAQMMMNQAGMALQNRVAPDKQEAVAKGHPGRCQEVPGRHRAAAQGPRPQARPHHHPAAAGREVHRGRKLKQVIVMLESPAIKKYQQLSSDMDTALRTKLIDDTRATVEPQTLRAAADRGQAAGHHRAARPAPRPRPAPPRPPPSRLPRPRSKRLPHP